MRRATPFTLPTPNYNSTGLPLAGCPGPATTNTATGFGTNVATTTSGSQRYGCLLRRARQQLVLFLRRLPGGTRYFGSWPAIGRHVRQRLFQLGQGICHEHRLCDRRRHRYGRLLRFAGDDTFYAFADYEGSGKQLAGMLGGYGGGYSDLAKGFGTNVAYATNGGTDLAAFFDSPDTDTFYAYADYNSGGQTLAGMYGLGGGYTDSATGFQTVDGISSSGGSDTATLVTGSGSNTLYTDGAIAALFGNDGSYAEQTFGFPTVTANGSAGEANTQITGATAPSYQLNLAGTWDSISGGYAVIADPAVLGTRARRTRALPLSAPAWARPTTSRSPAAATAPRLR